MSRIWQAKGRKCRSLGLKIWVNSSFEKRNYYPGQHGPNLIRKNGDYRVQLNAKQALKWHYGYISERYFRNVARTAKRKKGDSVENLVGMLESRLDAMVFRVSFASTIFAARQLVSHCHVLVNGKKVNIPSYSLKIGDIVSISEKAKKMDVVISAMENPSTLPSYIEKISDYEFKLVSKPAFSSVPYPCQMNPNFVIEYYSR